MKKTPQTDSFKELEETLQPLHGRPIHWSIKTTPKGTQGNPFFLQVLVAPEDPRPSQEP